MLSLDNILRRDRLMVLSGLAGISLLAWGYLVYEARVMLHTGVCHCASMAMSGPDVKPWRAAELLPLFLMWAEMMVAMMIPSAAPMILMFASVNRKRREQERPFVHTGIFVAGYLAVWTIFSALAAVAQWALHSRALLSPMMVSTSPIVGGLLLVGAGVFQWTHWKRACLSRCRSPLGFLLAGWREGATGAFVMGCKHGAFCTGCCWLLMALLFVAGVMNLWWVAILSVLVLVEKAAPQGLRFSHLVGILLMVWGTWMLAGGWK